MVFFSKCPHIPTETGICTDIVNFADNALMGLARNTARCAAQHKVKVIKGASHDRPCLYLNVLDGLHLDGKGRKPIYIYFFFDGKGRKPREGH